MVKQGRPYGEKWVQDKVLVFPPKEDCYIYKRPGSTKWQYCISIPGEGEERKSTKEDDIDRAKDVAIDRKLEVMARQKQGLKARRVKRMFDFIDKFLEEEEKRIAEYNKKGSITSETFRLKRHHLNLLKKFYGNRSIKLEDLDYPKLYKYPIWRQTTTDMELGVTPPKNNHTILTELTTIKAYFAYLMLNGLIPRQPDFHKIQRESSRVNRRDYLNVTQYQQTLNTVRAWAKSKNITNSQTYNRHVLYEAMIVMSNSCLRKGEIKGLVWADLEENPNLSKEEQKIGHLIKIRQEITKTGVPRTVQSPTSKRFEILRQLADIPKQSNSKFPHIPPEYRYYPIFSKFNHPDKPLGPGTWNRGWQEIKSLCASRYWNDKNITWYSFRHTGISFAVSRGVPMLLLSRNCGTGSRYIEEVYFHHEAESKKTWDTLNQNREFNYQVNLHKEDLLLPLEKMLVEEE